MSYELRKRIASPRSQRGLVRAGIASGHIKPQIHRPTQVTASAQDGTDILMSTPAGGLVHRGTLAAVSMIAAAQGPQLLRLHVRASANAVKMLQKWAGEEYNLCRPFELRRLEPGQKRVDAVEAALKEKSQGFACVGPELISYLIRANPNGTLSPQDQGLRFRYYVPVRAESGDGILWFAIQHREEGNVWRVDLLTKPKHLEAGSGGVIYSPASLA